MIYAINYANGPFFMSAKLNALTAKVLGGVDEVLSFKPEDIDRQFYKDHESILTLPRGNGYWLWKPYFIKKVLEDIDHGDYLIYSDSGSVYFRNVQNIIDRMNKDIYLGNVEGIEREYTKKDAFILLDADIEEIKNTRQFEATFIMIRKTNESVDFINEWLRDCLMGDLITDAKSRLGNDDDSFIEHRHDQSILSILAKKHNVEPHLGLSDPDRNKNPRKLIRAILCGDEKYINALKDKYINNANEKKCPRIFVHTRQKNTFILLFILREFGFAIKTFYREVIAEKIFYLLLSEF